MRTIKFRGKDIETGEWIYGDLFQRIGYYPEIITTYPDDNGKIAYKGIAVKPDKVCQYTGLVDKNGKEIYEGDVIRGKYDATHLIQYNEEEGSCFAYRLPISEFSFKGHLNQDWINEYSKVVIGNIHDNPELIEKITI